MNPHKAVFTGKHSTLYPQFVKPALVRVLSENVRFSVLFSGCTENRNMYRSMSCFLPVEKHINLCRFITITVSYDRICAHDVGTRMEIYGPVPIFEAQLIDKKMNISIF